VAKGTGKTGNRYTRDLLSVLQDLEPAWYGISIMAIAEAESGIGNSEDTDNTADGAWREVKKQPSVEYAWWHDEPGKARWVNVDGSSNYAVQLYKNGTALGGQVSVTRQATSNPGGGEGETITTHDFSSAITTGGAGSYTFRVLTKGNGYLILDAEEKASEGDAYVYSPAEPPGQGVTVTFIPANESGQLSVTGAPTSGISKTAVSATITLTITEAGFTDFTWVVDGRSITASGNGITLGTGGTSLAIDVADRAVKLGGHSVTVYAKKAGVPWSPVNPVGFTVIR
jgi:hypothetical protein